MSKLLGVDTSKLTTLWFDASNYREFEYYRNLALNDPTNHKRFDYTEDRLVITKHIAYGVVMDGSNPVLMGGLYDLGGFGRVYNRGFIFPEYRVPSSDWRNALKIGTIHTEYLFKHFYKVSPFDTHVMTMTNKGHKNVSRALFRINDHAWKDHWHLVDGYIKTSGRDTDPKAWQFAITDNPNYPFRKINHDQWLLIKETY